MEKHLRDKRTWFVLLHEMNETTSLNSATKTNTGTTERIGYGLATF
ncbi:hypothetical protein [Ohtaekwangia koreensis]|uniref:Uncharacterized protein n=1 Tax=Ohtaekwangia koreensis TaxID=688867 RepID=A0A1T5L6I2_9BACT|nr:hypothetical protein [Ohtaekwangia koreensis]SKC71543.1 hypothetical protein SAMN05660236_2625 [Ohtaekwangia koreensis]